MSLKTFYKKVKEFFFPKRPKIVIGDTWYLKGYLLDAPWELKKYEIKVMICNDHYVTFLPVYGGPPSTWDTKFFLASAKHLHEIHGSDYV